MAMRRALAILKYVPAILCGLLVVAWITSIFYQLGFSVEYTTGRTPACFFACGRLVVYDDVDGPTGWIIKRNRDRDCKLWTTCPIFEYHQLTPVWHCWRVCCPLTFVASVLVPLAIGPFTHFRFPLWSYFAWTALVAAELAFYLR
jgi:hypothetical protein